MNQEKIKTITEVLAGLQVGGSCPDQTQCCCPDFRIFVYFDDIKCVQIYNGACEDWRPGTSCGAPSMNGG